MSNLSNPEINWDSPNIGEEWRRFKQHAELMFKGPLAGKNEEVKVSYLLLWVGDRGRDISNTFQITEGDRKKLEPFYDCFKQYVSPKSNPIVARWKFRNRTQSSTENIETFVTDLRLLARDCEFTNTDEMIRDAIVFGTNSQSVREKLLQEGADLTLAKAIDIARSCEISKAQIKSMLPEINATVDRVDSISQKKRDNHSRSYKQRSRDPTCEKCGYQHDKKQKCPAKGKQCNKCGKWNHFEAVCKSAQQKGKRTKSVNAIDEEEIDTELFIDTIDSTTTEDQAYAKLYITEGNTSVNFKLDTGAQVNTLPAKVFYKMKLGGKTRLQPADTMLKGYGGEHLKVQGQLCLAVTVPSKNKTTTLTFFVVETDAPPVLCLRTCVDLELLKLVLSVEASTCEEKENLIKEFSELFTGVGELEGDCKLFLQEDAIPVVHPPRRIAFALRDKLKQELDKMERMNIVTKVTESTDWVNSLVVVEKPNGKLRICLDPKDLNAAIRRPYYNMPTLEDITSKLAGAKYFSVLDAKSGYWSIKLDRPSSLLTTFNSPFGRYRFLRLPFGINSAQDEFQRRMDEIYEGLNGVDVIVDDILVYGRTPAEHDRNLRAVLERSKLRGVRFNPDKAVIGVQEVSYFGHVLSADGIKPDPKKVKAITEMEAPTNRAELETVLGMANYLSKFAPSLSEVTAPLRDLTKKSNTFQWDANHDKIFQKMKDVVTQTDFLAYYDPSKEVTLQVDASKHGLGAALLQDGRPVAYASKSLNATEQNYAQIEKEMYAILFGCKRFHQYIYGRQITVESDHKPLEIILRKPLSVAPPRLQRMMLQLQKYHITVVHRPGKDIPLADTLSRKCLPDTDSTLSEGMEMKIHSVMTTLPVSDKKLQQLKEETEKDVAMTRLVKTIQAGWPEKRSMCEDPILPYWNIRDELSIIDRIIFKGEKILVPEAMRADMLKAIHTGHMGIEKCRSRARDILFWPGMNADIENLVSRCEICQERCSANQKEPLIPRAIPTYPWQVIGTDLFTFRNSSYIVVVDYYSRWLEFERLSSTTSAVIIDKLKLIFTRYGIPQELMSDNGPQYASEEFKLFTDEWDIKHVTSSPYYPKSNGFAERGVQTAKRLLEKAEAEKQDVRLSILEYNNTTIDNIASPAQMLMGRRLRSVLPSSSGHLAPRTVKPRDVHQAMTKSKSQQKQYYDEKAKPLPELSVYQPVRTRLPNEIIWRPATVISKHDSRSYVVQTEDGTNYRRNRSHIITQNPSTTPPSDRSQHNRSTHCSDADPTLTKTIEPLSVKPTTGSDSPPLYTTRSGRPVKQRTLMDL